MNACKCMQALDPLDAE